MKRLALMLLAALWFSPLAAHAQPCYSCQVTGGDIGKYVSSQTGMGAAGGAVPVGSGIGPTYLGEVATRAATPSTFIAGSSFNQFMSRSQHFARQAVTQLQIVVPNFFVNAGSGEIATGGTATYTASIEYPVGIPHQITFGGSVSGTVASGTTRLSDPVKVSIPNGGEFWVRMFYTNPAGVIARVFTNGQLQSNGTGDATAFGLNSLTDQTMSGTVASYNATTLMYPLAIVAPTVQATACLFGDSRMLGTQDSDQSASLDRGPVARYIGQRYGYINMGISSYTLGFFLSGPNANQVSLAQYCSFGIDQLGINDLAASNPTATVITERATFAALFPNLAMYGTTLEPESTSTDSWATTANQTTVSFNTARNTVNAAIIAGIPGELNYIDINGAIDPTNSGKWPATGAAGGCTLDGVHEVAASAQLTNSATACGAFVNPFRNIDFGRR